MGKSGTKRIAFLADLHCKSDVGLTSEPRNKIQEELLKSYLDCCEWIGKCDMAVWNGDLIDGKAAKDGGLGVTDLDPAEQAFDAAALCSMVRAKEHRFIAGTPYHTGIDADYEKIVAHEFGQTLRDKLRLDVNGFIFNVRHKVSSSIIPHGRHTGPAREYMWELLNAAMNERVPANMLIFAHVHYYTFAENSKIGVMTLPCWQAPGGRYGARQCTGRIDIGAVVFEIDKEGNASWQRRLYEIKAGHVRTERLL